MSFFKELKRRNVVRVGIAYVVTAWLIAQVAGLAADSFGAPAWVMKMIITMLVLGGPIALVLAWAYELTPDGLRRETGEDSAGSSRQAGGKLDRIIIIALVAALAYFAFDKFVLDPRRDAALMEAADRQVEPAAPVQPPVVGQPDTSAEQSIAVLAFANMSDDASNEYFSDGLSEELLNLLVKIPELRVAARTSSFSYKGKDVKVDQIGRELNVSHVLEGSVRKAGNQIRVTAQLIKADDGFHLWSETFDRNLDDIFVVQDEIAAAVIDSLKVTLLGAMPELQKTDPEVYALYLQGQHFSHQRTVEGNEKALEALQKALAIDPEYAPAWVALSWTYTLSIGYDQIPREQGSELSREALDRALAIDPNLASAWAALAYHKRSFDWDWEGARDAIKMAQGLEPNNWDVIGAAASIASTFGRLDEAIELFERNVVLNPLSLSSLLALGNRYVAVGRYDEAREQFRQVMALNPNYRNVQLRIASTYARQGEPERALEELEKVEDKDSIIYLGFKACIIFDMGRESESQAIVDEFLAPSGPDHPYSMAYVQAWRGEYDEAFRWLEVAFEQRNASLSFILWNSNLARLGNDPRFPVFLEKLGLREAWEAMPPGTLAEW